jgi:hypothetical protein
MSSSWASRPRAIDNVPDEVTIPEPGSNDSQQTSHF